MTNFTEFGSPRTAILPKKDSFLAAVLKLFGAALLRTPPDCFFFTTVIVFIVTANVQILILFITFHFNYFMTETVMKELREAQSSVKYIKQSKEGGP